MAKGRKNGCPVNIKNWLIYILDVATNEFVRIFGLNSLTRSTDSETEDGSADTETWSEPYVTKRSGSLTLEGKEVVVESTGDNDPGQAVMRMLRSRSLTPTVTLGLEIISSPARKFPPTIPALRCRGIWSRWAKWKYCPTFRSPA